MARFVHPQRSRVVPEIETPAVTFRGGFTVSYKVKEIFYSIQGEGANAGRAAVFCRFAGCNLWSGREQDRADAVCKFCDTDFVGGTKYETSEDLSRAILSAWTGGTRHRFVIFTGGEPALQLDSDLIAAIHDDRFEIAIETNGTIRPPAGIDWICVSPKAGTEIVVTAGDEVKLVYPQDGVDPKRFEAWPFARHYLQPMDGPNVVTNTRAAVAYCLANPKWRISLQTHKFM